MRYTIKQDLTVFKLPDLSDTSPENCSSLRTSLLIINWYFRCFLVDSIMTSITYKAVVLLTRMYMFNTVCTSTCIMESMKVRAHQRKAMESGTMVFMRV